MGSFWKKMLRLSRARSKGLAHGADFNTSEVRRGFCKVVGQPWGGGFACPPSVPVDPPPVQRHAFGVQCEWS